MKKNIYIKILCALAAIMVAGVPAQAKSFLDSVNEALGSAEKAIDNAQKTVDKTVNDVNKTLGEVNKAMESIPAGVENGTYSTGNGNTVTVNRSTSVIVNGAPVNNDGGNLKRISDDAANTVNKTVNDVDRTVSQASKTINDAKGSLEKNLDKIKKILGDENTNKVNKTVNDVDRTVSDASRTINEAKGTISRTVDNAKKIFDDADNTTNQTGTTVDKTIKTIGDIIKNPGQIFKQKDPTTVVNDKALTVMALFGDQWAKLKLEQMRAQDKADQLYQNYQSISWLNIFKKFSALSEYEKAKKEVTAAENNIEMYEQNNPNAGKIVSSINSINEKFLEVKAMFGDKKAQATLDYIKAKKEYDEYKKKYDQAGFFEKFSMKSTLKYFKERYDVASKAMFAASGVNVANSSPTNTGRIADRPAVQQKSDDTHQGGIIAGQSGTIINVSKPAAKPVNQALNFVKEKVDAAYRKYIDCMNSPNPDPTTLKKYEQEYLRVLEEYKMLSEIR